MKTLALNVPAGGTSGWGWYAANLIRHASRAGWAVHAPVIDWATLPPEWRLEGWNIVHDITPPIDVLITPFGNRQVIPPPDRSIVQRAYVSIFFEDTDLPTAMVDALNQYDGVICGSDWNRDLLTRAGVTNAVTVLQGADPPSYLKRPEYRHARCRIFSGGKLEFRKGQDIVVAAFRGYLKHDPDALLVTAWQNHWPQTMTGIDAMGYVKGWPATRKDGLLDIVGWCVKNGIPERNVIDLGMPPSWALQRAMVYCDLAVFPNRAEGGHNLVAAEALAASIPVAASDGTGQRHLLDHGAAALDGEPVTATCKLYRGMDGWIEVDPSTVTGLFKTGMLPAGLGTAPPPSWEESVTNLLRIVDPQ